MGQVFVFRSRSSFTSCLLFLISEEKITNGKVFHQTKALDTFPFPLQGNITCGNYNMYTCVQNRSDYFILLQKIGNANANTAREFLTEAVEFTLFKSKTGSLPQRCPLYSVFICKKIPKSQSDFHFKRILRERQRSCHHKTYFNFNS